ncbi:MAG TPA: hypothetical protein VKH19_18450 [Gemmatimonadaceae bacterium]|nr:hypothetical protein [Gemmatimonadaceae bacterium]
MGWFSPTEIGERLMPTLTFLGPFHERISRAMSDGSPPGVPVHTAADRNALAHAALRYRITDEAGDALDALQLELHDEQGRVVATEHMSVEDTEYLLALDADGNDESDVEDMDDYLHDDTDVEDEFNAALLELGIDEEEIDAEAGPVESWASERDEAWGSSTLPRYQVFVELSDGRSIPVADRWTDDPYVQALVAGHDPLADAIPFENKEE